MVIASGNNGDNGRMTGTPSAVGRAALDPEDATLVVLARGARGRVAGAIEGAAVRDTDGRTYAAASVDLPSLRLSAVQAAVAAAVSSGARGLEAAVVVGDAAVPAADDLSVVLDLADRATAFLLVGTDGALRSRHGVGLGA